MTDTLIKDVLGRGIDYSAFATSSGADATPVYAGKTGTSNRTSGVLDAVPAAATESVVTYVPQDFKAGDVIAKLAINVNTAGDGAAVADVGIYGSTVNGRPGARLAHTGNLDVTSQPAAATVTYTILATGRYWLACVTTGSTVTPATIQTVVPPLPLAVTSADPLTVLNGSDANAYAEASATLPATATAAPIAITSGAFAVGFSFA
jgi:hypothetical protein